MSDIGGAFFWGEMARSTDEARRAWEQLWQQEEDRRSREEMQREQIQASRELAISNQNFQERMAQANRDFQEGIVDRQEQQWLFNETEERWAAMNTEERIASIENLEAHGNIGAPLLRQQLRQTWFSNPQEAKDLIDSVFTAPVGTKFNPWAVNQAMDVLGSLTGDDEEALAQLRADVQSALEQRMSGGEEWDELQWGMARGQLGQLEANINQTKATTAVQEAQAVKLDAETQSILQRAEFDAQEQPMVLENMSLINQQIASQTEGSNLANFEQSIRLGYLPDQLANDVARGYEEVRGLKNENELMEATRSYTIRQIVAQTTLSEEEAQFAVDTHSFRVALAEGSVEEQQAQINLLGRQAENVAADTTLTEAQREHLVLQGNETRAQMLSDLVANGDGELVKSLAPELLRQLGVPGDTAALMVESLVQTAVSNRSTQTKIEDTQLRIALAEAEVAEAGVDDRIRLGAAEADRAEADAAMADWEQRTAQTRYDNQMEVEREKLDIMWDQNAIDRERIASNERLQAASIAAANARAGEGAPVTKLDVVDGIRTATGLDIKEVSDANADYLATKTTLDSFTSLILNPEANAEEIQRIITDYGLSAGNLHEAKLDLERQANDAAEVLRGRITVYLNHGVDGGVVFTPQDLGLTGSAVDIYYEAAQGVTGLNVTSDLPDEAAEAPSEMVNDYFRWVSTVAKEAGDPTGAAMVGAQVVWDQMVSKYGMEAVVAAGWRGPEDMAAQLGNAAENYATAEANAMNGINVVTKGNPQMVDLNNPESLNNTLTMLQTLPAQYQRFSQQLDQLPEGRMGFIGFDRNYGEGRAQVAASFIRLFDGVYTPEELANMGIIGFQYGNGELDDYFNVDKARQLLESESAKRWSEAAALTTIRSGGGFR